MQCDTFDDIPDNLCNPLWINEQIFGPLSSYVGPVFSGLASNAFTSTDVEWGRSLQLSETETLQLRIYPRGVVSNGRLVDTKSNVVLVAARRKSSVAKDYVTFAILWHSEQEIDHGFSAFDTIKNCSQTVAARNLHIVLPSLFNHHDATFGGAPEGAKPNPAWPILDEFNFEAVKPSSFSVHRPHKMPSGETLMSMTAAPGVSQFVIGGHFAGIDTDNCHYRSAEPLPYNKWQEIVQKYTTKMQTQVGFDKGLKAMHNAMTLADMLTCEGILGILGHSFANGALPDMMHSPGGFPLLIAFATRLACYPQRFGLTVGTHTDQLANRELISLFESNWEPISPMKAGDRNVYAIDLALRRAHDEAREHARKNDTKLAVTDNTTFWHRAGQRCVTAVFGPTVYDFIPPLTSFQEPPSKLMDPLLEARVRVIQKQMKMAEAVTGNEGRMSMQLATTDQKRNILLMVLNSVEHWLRTGTYCGMQIHRKNTVGVHIKRPGGKKPISKKDLREQLHSGIEDSVRDMMASGEYDDEDKARAAAKVLSDGIEAAMMGVPDDETIDFNDLDMDFPWKFVNQHDAIANGESSRGSQQPFTDAAELDHDNICIDAFHGAISCISASMCQGPMVHHQFSMGVFLSCSGAVNQCADCDEQVHVLGSCFLSTRFGSCARCMRPRCISCSTRFHAAIKTDPDINPLNPTRFCKRCGPGATPSKKPTFSPDTRERALVAAGFGKSGNGRRSRKK